MLTQYMGNGQSDLSIRPVLQIDGLQVEVCQIYPLMHLHQFVLSGVLNAEPKDAAVKEQVFCAEIRIKCSEGLDDLLLG
ncbi:MAG: hypothetical protein N4A70_01640 [Pelagimonas sp.]|nr:hypothetical protein [Pelagimonas sp.]